MFLVRIKVILVILFIKCNLNYESASAGTLNSISHVRNYSIKTVQKIQYGMDNYCLNSECIHTASRVLEFMDSSVDPCDNFYKFSCGQFIKTREIPNDTNMISSIDFIQDEINNFMKNFLEKEVKPTEPKHVKLVKNLYRSCMDITGIKLLPPTLDMLKKMGGWPLLEGDSWKAEGFQWEEFMSKVEEETGLTTSFFSVSITFDKDNSSKHILEIEQPTLAIYTPSDYYNILVDIAVNFGADKLKSEAELKQIHKIEMDLRNISLSDEELMREFPSKMTVKELKGNYSNILWKEYFNVFLNPYYECGDDEIIQISGRSFFEKFNELIERIPKRDQVNFIVWKVVERVTKFLNRDVEEVTMKLDTAVTGQEETTPKSIECYNLVGESINHGVSAIYIQNCFNEESKRDVTEITNIILDQLKINIQNAEWLDNKTKKLALEKIRSIYASVAYADEFLDGKNIDNYYKELEINSENYLQAFVNITKFKRLNKISNLRKLVNRTNWIYRENTAIINAGCRQSLNIIDIHAAILSGMFYNNKIPKYMNYGGIGSVIGHEIIHSVGVFNSNYDAAGNIVDWWTPEAKEEFLKRAQCFIYQYGNYTVEEVGLKLDSYKTQEENIADTEGIKIAYLAYMRWVKNHGPESLFRGLNYTPSQLFWISHAQTWCAKKNSRITEIWHKI